jgi:hypothetical protein
VRPMHQAAPLMDHKNQPSNSPLLPPLYTASAGASWTRVCSQTQIICSFQRMERSPGQMKQRIDKSVRGHAAGFIDPVPSSFSTLYYCFYLLLKHIVQYALRPIICYEKMQIICSAFLLIALSSLSSSQDVLQRRDYQQDPIMVSASQYWGGNDGQWSSFVVQLGHPAQTMKVLVPTSASVPSVHLLPVV